MEVEVAYLTLSEDWLIYSEQLLSIKMLLMAVVYLSIPTTGWQGLKEMHSGVIELREKGFAEALLCEGRSESKVAGDRIIPQDRGCTFDLKILK